MVYASVVVIAVAGALAQGAPVPAEGSLPRFDIAREARVELIGTFPEGRLTGRLVSVAKKTLMGAAVGAALGAGLALALEADCTGACDGIDPRFVARMALTCAPLGAAVGLAVGALTPRRDWVTIPMEGYELQLRGGGGDAELRFSLRF